MAHYFRVETIDGTAEAASDYKPLKSKIYFKPNEILQQLYIEIIDDDVWEPDEFFFAKLFIDKEDEDIGHVTLGNTSINQITIINDDGRCPTHQGNILYARLTNWISPTNGSNPTNWVNITVCGIGPVCGTVQFVSH